MAVCLYLDQGFDASTNNAVAFPILWGTLGNGATWLRKPNFPQPLAEDEGGSEPKRAEDAVAATAALRVERGRPVERLHGRSGVMG